MLTLGRISLLILWGCLSSFLLGMSLVVTNPLAIGPIGVTLWFLLLFSDLAALLAVVLYGVKAYFHVHGSAAPRLRYSWRQGLLLGGYITGLLALSSLDQFSWRDALLLGLVVVIAEVYVRFRWP